MINNNLDEPSSYLGESPTCDVCGKYIVAGDQVLQKFFGVVCYDPTSNELGIKEDKYELCHVKCLVYSVTES